MAQLEILQCSGCGSPLAPVALSCEYCGNKNLIKSKRNPLKLTSKAANEYISFYSDKAKKDPKDANALYAMGLLYLSLKNYELARRSFRDAIDQSPLDPDVYYYYALSLLAGENIKAMGAKDVERVEQYLGTAINMESKCKYLALLAAVKEEYYVQNQLVVRGDSPRALFEQAKEYSPEDLDEIPEHCLLNGENTQYNIDLLTGKAESKAGSLKQEMEEVDTMGLTQEDVDAAYALTAEQRKQFYDYRFEPDEPGTNPYLPDEIRLRSKESWVGLVFRRLWKLALNAVLTLVLFIICLLASWGFVQTERPLDTPTIAEAVALKEAGMQKKLTTKECAALFESMRADSVATAQQDSIIAATNIKLYSKANLEDQIEDTLWLKKSTGGYIWFIVVLLPLLVWLFVTIAKCIGISRSRQAAGRINRQIWNNFADANELHETKPTDMQMMLFIHNFLSYVVPAELAFHGKNEQEMKGKILFLNSFFDYKEDGPNYGDSAVEYKIVLLEADCVSVISSDWRVYEDISDTGVIESISYSDIREVRLTEKELSFGGITVEIPDAEEQLFSYQDTDTDNEVTFSNTRTSDARQFAVALRRLHTGYKNSKQNNQD